MSIILSPVAFVSNDRNVAVDDNWANIVSTIELADGLPDEVLDGIESFSHLDIIYFFDKVEPQEIKTAGHPRGNKNYPKMGIFAQRKKDRPNTIGLCRVELISHKGRTITVKYLDAINGTPILDIKPVFREFEQQSEIQQPDWVADLMKNYW